MGRRFWLSTAAWMVAGVASVAHAGGYEIPENNPRALGRAGANIAHVGDASATYFNPGALSRLDSFHFSGGLNFPLQFSRFQRADFVFPMNNNGTLVDGTIQYTESRNSLGALPAPALFIAHDFGLKNTSFGLGLYGPSASPQIRWDRLNTDGMRQPGAGFGQSRETTRDGGHAYMIEDADLIVLYPSLTASHYFEGINLGIGASLQLVYANTKVRLGLDGLSGVGLHGLSDATVRSEQRPNGVLFDENPANFVETRVNTSGFGVTGNLGFVWDPIPQVSVGMSYRPAHRVMMKGNFAIIAPALEGMDLTLVNDDAKMEIVMPHVLRAGVNYRHIVDDFEVFDIELAATYEMWSIVDKMTAQTPGPVSSAGFDEPRPIANVDIPFNFKNTVSLRLGGDYNGLRDRSTGQGVTLRGGLFWESNGVSKEYSNLMFMPFGRIGLSAGLSYHFKQEKFSDLSIDFGALWLHNFKRTVTNGKMDIIAPLWVCHNGEAVNGASKEDIMATCEAQAAAGDSPYHAVNNGTYKTDILTLAIGVTYAF